MEKIKMVWSEAKQAWVTADPNKVESLLEAYRASEVDAMILRYTEDMKYIQGIVERGTGYPVPCDKPIRVALLEYVKKLEAYRQAVNALVELVKEVVEPSGKYYDPECNCLNCLAEKYIAAVERLGVE